MTQNDDGLISRSDLSDFMRVRLKEREKRLNRKCRKLWTFTNPLGERFIFGQFWRNRDPLIVTVAKMVDGVGWIDQSILDRC